MLTQREKIVLQEVVRRYIDTATPVSSTLIARKSRLGMSPATIRNTLASLEHKGYIYQPHTSAGRVPKTRGYRTYVDNLMKKARLSSDERESILESIRKSVDEVEDILRAVTHLLSHLSHQLGVIVSPRVEEGRFERLELIDLTSDKLLMIISIQSGFVKTITLEAPALVSRNKLTLVSQILNERLYGRKISQIRQKFSEIVRDLYNEESGLISLLIRQADRLFHFDADSDLYFMGAHYIVQQPDFSDPETISSVVEMLETRKIIVHLMEDDQSEPLSIKIGEEIREQKMKHCSIISARYRIGGVSGVLGVIGPTRINYSKMVSLVDFTARVITDTHGKN